MHSTDWLQFALFIGLLALITKPLGIYLTQVLDANGKTWLDPVIRPLESLTYSLMGLDRNKEQGWKQYTLAMLLFSLVGVLFTYLILRFQHLLPMNPQHLPGLSDHLAFNTAVSFTTNLALGSTGANVTALQQSLIASGYSLPSGATGYFGAQTQAAVIAYQKAHGIAQVGTVGPQTRASLNSNSAAATPTSSTSATSQTSSTSSGSGLTTVQISAIIGLLQSFGANSATIAQVQSALQ